MLVNSTGVVGVGVLIFPVLKRHHEISAYGYLSAQVVQGVMLAVGVVFLMLRIPLAQQLEERVSQGPPVWSRHVGDPILESNITRRVDFALFT
jgi:hypothetical protein